MMELYANLVLGFGEAFTLTNLLYCFIGVVLGTAVGVLPGLGPIATIAMLLPLTFQLPATSALIMLAGIYYGAQYGGSTTAILINLPGESSSVVTALDGYQMARQGRAGPALFTCAVGSFFAGTVATFLIAGFAPGLAAVALTFGPEEYFSLMVLGLAASIALAHGSLIKAIAMVVLGLLLSTIGKDLYTGTARFNIELAIGNLPIIEKNDFADGVEFVAIVMGVFGMAEIVRNLENEQTRSVLAEKIKSLIPSREEVRRIIGPILRGTGLGAVLGILPGGGAMLASFAAYSFEKRVSGRPRDFGKGTIEGVAAPEAANNAGAQTSFIPMLTLGIPSNPVMALMIGAMVIKGITPGPNVVTDQPVLFWGLIVSMWIGNIMLLILNLPLIGMWVRMLRVPYRLLFPVVIGVCCIGVFSVRNDLFDVYLMAAFSLLGYLLIKFGFEMAPMLLGFVIGTMLEEYLRRAMLLSRGDPLVFFQNPKSAIMLIIAFLALAISLIPTISQTREEAFKE